MIRNMFKKIDMFWLILIVILLTYYFQMLLSDALASSKAATVAAFWSGNLNSAVGAANQVGDIKIMIKVFNFMLFIEILYLILATNINYSFSNWINKYVEKIPEKIRRYSKLITLWLIALFGLSALSSNAITFVYMIICLLPLIKNELERDNGILKNID